MNKHSLMSQAALDFIRALPRPPSPPVPQGPLPPLPPPPPPLPPKEPEPTTISVKKEYRGLDALPGTPVPSIPELLSYCTVLNPEHPHYPMGLPYPKEKPVYWIKYGSYQWNSVPAQVMAYNGLREIHSPVRAPGLFYACLLSNYKTYMVMEYIPGKTAAQLLEGLEDPVEKENIYRKMAFGVHELVRIPVPADSPPAGIDGDIIWHTLFYEAGAPRQYQTVDQLEQHLNLWLKIAKRRRTVEGLTKEPMVFCQSDMFHGNFMIDDDGNVVMIDFALSSIVPSSFAKYAALGIDIRHDYPILEWVDVPSTDGIDNVAALGACRAPFVQGSHSFAMIGRRIP